MTSFSHFVGKVPFLCGFVALIFKRKADNRLTQEYHGVKFVSPVGLAAGFDKNGEMMPTIEALGFGFGTVGSVTSEPCAGNPRPWFYRLPKTQSAVVNAGLGNQGSRIILERLRQSYKITKQFPVVLSVAKNNSHKVVTVNEGIADYVATVKRAKKEASIQMIELNVSCPNAFGGEPFTTPDKLEKLLSAIDDIATKQPVYVKMPLNLSWDEFKALLDIIMKHQVAGVTIANLMKDRLAVDLKDDLPDTVPGNLSGKPTWELSNELISKTYKYCGDKLTIIGAGGIFSADDAYAKIKLGASLIEIITGMIFNGPQLAAEINEGLLKLMKRDGFTNIGQAIGIDSKKL